MPIPGRDDPPGRDPVTSYPSGRTQDHPSSTITRPRWRPTSFQVAGIASLANGIALLGTIVGGASLTALLVVSWTTAAVSIALIVALADAPRRRRLVETVVVGLVGGLVATIVYDATKTVLSQLDTSPFNPFEATNVFGRLLLGEGASSSAVTIAGWAFHLANGCTFAVAYGLLLARGGAISRTRGVVTGIGWGLFLETFQLVLYPGWLSVAFLDEFRQISFLSHLAFGAVLGLLIPSGLRFAGRRTIARQGSRR